jgi:hypothetical protein
MERCDLSVRGQSQSKGGGGSAKLHEEEREKTGISTKGDD